MDTTTWVFTPIPNAKLVFSKSQVDGHHIWHDPHLLTFANGLCSDAFAEALSSSGMTGVAVTPRETPNGNNMIVSHRFPSMSHLYPCRFQRTENTDGLAGCATTPD